MRRAEDRLAGVLPILVNDAGAGYLLGVDRTTIHRLRNGPSPPPPFPCFPQPVSIPTPGRGFNQPVRFRTAELLAYAKALPTKEVALAAMEQAGSTQFEVNKRETATMPVREPAPSGGVNPLK